MNRTTTASPARLQRSPWIVRAAHQWYAWTGIAATVTGTFLAANGQLRFGEGPQLRAADGVNWKPSAPPAPVAPPEAPKPAPVPDGDDPFKAAAPTKVELPPAPPAPPTEAATKPGLNDKVGAILEAYTKNKPEAPAIAEPAKLPSVEGPALPDLGGTDVSKPGVPRTLPLGTTALLPPIPDAPMNPLSGAKPLIAPPAAGPKLVQDKVQEIPILPRPVEPKGTDPKAVEPLPEEKKEPAVRKRKILGTLSPQDEIKLNAAQTEARLRNFNRAVALMAEVIRSNPDEYDLRAEYAGILLQAGDYRGAIRELETVIRSAPNVVGYRLLLGDALLGVGQNKAAADVFLSALEMIGDDPRFADRVPEVVVRAARAYAFDQEYFRAAALVDKFLAGLKPDDPRAPVAMGAVLLDLDRPYDALPYLIEKRKQLLASPEASEEYELKLLEVLASMVRGYARVGDRQQAMDAINELGQKAPRQVVVRTSLADILFGMNEHELAGHVYNQVLAVDPANGAALIGIARVYLETYQPSAAKRVLDSFIPAPALQRSYLLAYSSYHQTIGEYTEAKQIYKDMLRRNENDHDVRFALGRVYEYTKEWEKGKGEFAKIPPLDKNSRQARLWFGVALLSQRKFAEAAGVAEQFLHDDPNNAEGLALLVRALAKMGQFEKAVQAGRGYLSTNPRDDRAATLVRLAVGRALLEGNRNLEAAREFEIALSKPAGRVPEAYYGLARAAEKLGNGDRAQQIIGTLCGAAGTDIRNRLALADFYSMDFEDQKVIEIINGFPGYDNNNLALLIRLADAQQRAARWPGNPADAFATASLIIRQSPTNVRGHLVMARSFATTQNFRKASVQYDQLIAIDPEFTIPPRERARILYSDHQYSAARTQYNVVLSPTPEDVVMTQMTYHVQKDARLRQAFAPYLNGSMTGPALRAELARLVSTCPDEESRLAAHRLICDYDATLAWQEAFRLERDAKELKGYRNYMAIPQYNAANQFEPTNTETAFDEGQVYGALKMTRAALTWYANTLAIDPTHRESAAASERASAEISPKFDARYECFDQEGRDGLADITRHRYISAVSLPLGDENEYVQFGYMRMAYNPRDDRQLWGNAPFIRAQKKFDDNRLMLYGQANLEVFEDRFGPRFEDRLTFDAGFWYDHNDVVRGRGGVFMENVAENGESMRQDIHRYGAYIGGDVRPTRTWAFGGTGTYAHYSDDNDMLQGYLYNEVSLSLPPKQLKLVQRLNAWHYREQSIFPTEPPNENFLRGMTHPYFAPDKFSTVECRVEWWHWLSRDYFVHSNQCWYSLQYGIATDKDLVTYHNFKAIVNYDINSYFTVGAEASTQLSSVYDQYQAMAFLQVRFLGH